ncbi:hypothetical protein POX_g08846 [Penicillium oxalicum]|uniref:hypothetical protein n=1 Tax=Penicillium oxalicum TaxID=69781 RepID=UPI0020B7AE45|nr:hypothetical protein POX_g08846 [Penicillium oxalicum]KAI2786460.1 hypothetical protein POX_g08846 [Penicillium oxalicum]
MKFSVSSSLALLLLPALTVAAADVDSTRQPNSRLSSESSGVDARYVDAEPAIYDTATKGSLDVPVDRMDGKPHAGPWVETTADRDRKTKSNDGTGAGSAKDTFKASSGNRPGIEAEAAIPNSNGGVMDDPSRPGPKEGTRGTEGGVSEKEKVNQAKSEKVPGSPKEATTASQREAKAVNRQRVNGWKRRARKPADLPTKPHDIPHPKSPSQAKEDPLAVQKGSPVSGSYSSSKIPGLATGETTVGASDGLHSLLFSFTMIIVSEIGDKTFLVAALMAMRHPRLVVFSAAFCALFVMTVLSAVLGHAVPTLIPKSVTKLMAAVLFLVFGAKMFKEGREMSPDEGVGEEMREVEMELEEKEQEQRRMGRRRSSVTPHSLEAGRAGGRAKSRGSSNRLPSPPESVSSSSSRGSSPTPGRRFNDMMSGVSNLFSLLLSPAWVQTFVMTFLGEWGDRSQIATIAMAAGQDYWWVTVGAITGHAICTAAAVIGGRAIAGRVSLRVVTLGGATAFFVFGIIYLIEGLY